MPASNHKGQSGLHWENLYTMWINGVISVWQYEGSSYVFHFLIGHQEGSGPGWGFGTFGPSECKSALCCHPALESKERCAMSMEGCVSKSGSFFLRAPAWFRELHPSKAAPIITSWLLSFGLQACIQCIKSEEETLPVWFFRVVLTQSLKMYLKIIAHPCSYSRPVAVGAIFVCCLCKCRLCVCVLISVRSVLALLPEEVGKTESEWRARPRLRQESCCAAGTYGCQN